MWPSCPNRQLRAASQLKIVAALNVNGSGTASSADYGAYRSAFAATGDGPNDRAHRSTNGRSLNGFGSLVVISDRAFIVYADCISLSRPYRFEDTGKAI